MKKAVQLTFNFDDYDTNTCLTESLPQSKPQTEHSAFPSSNKEMPLIDALSLALTEIGKYLKNFPPTIPSTVFELIFIEGKERKEISQQPIKNSDITLPCPERIRQIIKIIAHELSVGCCVQMLNNVKLKASICKRIKTLTERQTGMYIDTTNMPEPKQKTITGVAHVLSMSIIAKDSVLPMLEGCFIVGKDVSKEVFKKHYLATFQTLQENVRHMSFDALTRSMAKTVVMKDTKVDNRIVRLCLKDSSKFTTSLNDNGVEQYIIKYEYLRYHQQLARIIYEKKSISPQELQEETLRRGNNTNVFSMTQTHKKYPWCVPMGKVLWLYREDETALARIQDVIKEYCEEHVAFSYTEINDYLRRRGYNMIEGSLRNYIMRYCRRLNADRNMFRLTETVPKEEDHLWYKRVKPTKRKRVIAYSGKLQNEIMGFISQHPRQRIPRAELKRNLEPFFAKQGININNFYKWLNKIDNIELVEVEGVAYVALKK